MQAKLSPLFVIIDPPGIQYGMPGETIEINVVVRNEGKKSAIIDLYFSFDDTLRKILNWSDSQKKSLTLAPEQTSNEVTFKLEIAIDALPGTYNYTFVVDSPEHYPQDTPISFPGQVKVLLKEQTVIRASDPIFSIQPTTNPNKPLVYKSDGLLQVKLKVENRSARVDRFHLTCPELDENSLKISYPETGVEAAGLLEVNALELNPSSYGQILLEFYPPSNILAGTYSPTIRLHSANNPELILLDLVYINIPISYEIGADLKTILGKVSRKAGKFKLILINQGNLVRELSFSAKGRDEDELCNYKFEPKEIKLLPSKSVEADLTVKPRPWWRRPWIGRPLAINFQVDIEDKQNLPITTPLPQGVLEWKSRPIWQILLLILAGFGLVAAGGYFLWRYLYPDSLRIESFNSTSQVFSFRDPISLNWKISNYKQLKRIEIITTQPADKDSTILNQTDRDFFRDRRLFSQNQNESICKRNDREATLTCTNFEVGLRPPEQYTFQIKVSYRKRHSFFDIRDVNTTRTASVKIEPPKIAEIGNVNINTNKAAYTKGDKIPLSWSVENPENLDKITVLTKNSEGITQESRTVSIKDNCAKKEEPNEFVCRISMIPRSIGTFFYELKASSSNDTDRESVQKSEKIKVVAKPSKIIYLKLNERDISQNTYQTLRENEKAILRWKVEGKNEDVKVELIPNGNLLPLSGKREINVTKNLNKIGIKVTDISGRPPKEQFFGISVEEELSPPNIFIIPPSTPSP
ncbi:MAG: hypothetical protein ACFB2X_03875 [Rivularia sp. (in: cyanobacteria)]